MMGFVSTIHGKPATVTYSKLTQTWVNGQLTGTSWAVTGTFTGFFQRGSLAQNVVSDQFKADVAAILFVDPEDLPSGLTEIDYKLTIAGEDYSIIYVDNIEDVSIEIPLKLWS